MIFRARVEVGQDGLVYLTPATSAQRLGKLEDWRRSGGNSPGKERTSGNSPPSGAARRSPRR